MKRNNHIHTIGIRCTEEELQLLMNECQKRNITRSEYLRRKIFDENGIEFPVEMQTLFEEMKDHTVLIGNEISQYLRSNPDMAVRENFEIVIKLLEKIDYKYQKIYQEAKQRKGKNEDGDNKAGETESLIRGPPGTASAEQYPIYLQSRKDWRRIVHWWKCRTYA